MWNDNDFMIEVSITKYPFNKSKAKSFAFKIIQLLQLLLLDLPRFHA